MKFKGTPELFVRFNNKFVIRATGKKGFFFDKDGLYETDNEVLIRLLKQCFEVVETTETAKKEEAATITPQAVEEIAPAKVFKCKYCDYETESMGLLLAHYRKAKHKQS